MPAHKTDTDPDPPPFELNDTDRQVLAQTDEEFHLQTWEELKQIIADNDLAILKRKPSDLVRYIAWSSQTKAAYGSITNFICQERLHWKPLPSPSPSETGPLFAYKSPVPFASSDDYRILRNDWPYGLTPDITHLIVWLKTTIPVDEATGDLTPESRQRIEDFVEKTFCAGLRQTEGADDRVLWFKNWTQLQSVRGLEHVHILVRNVPEDIIFQWSGDGKPEGSLDGNA